MNNEIFLRRRNKIFILKKDTVAQSKRHVATIAKNVQSLGYVLAPDVLDILYTYSINGLDAFHKDLIRTLKNMLGAHVEHKPMYPNFPTQVMDADETELYINAIFHYFGDMVGARIMPVYDKEERPEFKDFNKLKVISLGTEKEFIEIFQNLLGVKIAVSESDKQDISWYVTYFQENIKSILPAHIPNKENLCYFVGLLKLYDLATAKLLRQLFKTSTDVLRLITAMSGGDVSLADNTIFSRFPRSDRRLFLSLLENCANLAEDMVRHRNRWIRIGEILHPGEYRKQYPKTLNAFSLLRNAAKIATFNSKYEEYMRLGQWASVIQLLSTRSGEFARRLDRTLRTIEHRQDKILNAFEEVANQVATPALIQLKHHFETRNTAPFRVFMPKGNVAKLKLEVNELPKIDKVTCNTVVKICENALIGNFSSRQSLGKVYIDETLKAYTLPLGLRSTSKSLRTVGRGSRIKLDKNYSTIRMFLWWKEGEETGRVDIDLSAVLYDTNWKYLQHISWTSLSSARYKGYHSGDIISAPNGASEFIDLDIESVQRFSGCYVVMNVINYTNHKFNELPECFAGCMMRSDPASGEIYEPRSVKDKFDLTSDSRYCVPLIFDLEKNEVIWCDVSLNSKALYITTVENNQEGIMAIGKAFTQTTRPNLYDLLTLHVKARGKSVTKQKAELVFNSEIASRVDEVISQYM